MERPLLRLALMTLPFLFGLSGLAAIVIAPFAWGAGDHAGLAPWMPPATALAFGVPGLLIAERCLRSLRARTATAFSVAPALLFFGVLAMPVAIVVLITIAAGVADASTYDRLLGSDGEPDFSQAGYMVTTVVVAAMLNALLAAACAGYASAVTDQRPGRHDRGKDEVDGVGELLERRNQTF